MILLVLLAVFFATLVSGPAWEDWRLQRKSRRDFPVAKVAFMLPSICETDDR